MYYYCYLFEVELFAPCYGVVWYGVKVDHILRGDSFGVAPLGITLSLQKKQQQ